ncbi:hypothetical protein IW261DRAFT_1565608 [Armillaria novae-zelandiae]|uniref:Uncharacterized protein n=1 Tax=Armillaria novae-zelandiae TaxID=153914 RepID=A0AA39U986_9AGAR|nr:hypothetical protein IW261DRAFT_1565608 [Armillaria novae-zelandiae]
MPASMGRPQKYHSQDEQRQAHAESSARSYTKHKSKINKRRQRKYRVAHPPSKESAAPTHQNMSQPKHVIKSLSKRLVEQASAKNNEFLTLLDRSPRAYADRLYHRFMVTVTRMKPGGDDDEICQELMKIGELVTDVTVIEDRILNAAGIGEDLAAVEHIREGMQEVERWLEDILCGTLEGIDILTKAYQDQTLLYQHVAK